MSKENEFCIKIRREIRAEIAKQKGAVEYRGFVITERGGQFEATHWNSRETVHLFGSLADAKAWIDEEAGL